MDQVSSPSAITLSYLSGVIREGLDIYEDNVNCYAHDNSIPLECSEHDFWQQEHLNKSEPLTGVIEVQDLQELDSTVHPNRVQRELPVRTRHKQTSPKEWNRICPIFTELYRDKNLKLSHVITLMSTDHGFHATPSMYKKRIADWGLCKNMKKDEKESVLHSIAEKGILSEKERQYLRIDKIVRYSDSKRKGAGDAERNDVFGSPDGFIRARQRSSAAHGYRYPPERKRGSYPLHPPWTPRSSYG